MSFQVSAFSSPLSRRGPKTNEGRCGKCPIFHLPSSIFQRRARRSRGFALVAVVIVVAVLTIMSVAFMQSMRIDRLTARAYLNKTRAEMAVEAGVETAIERLVTLYTNNAYFGFGYEALGGEAVPVFLGAGDPNSAPQKTYLISTDTPTTAPAGFNSSNSVDLNDLPGSSTGWIGSPLFGGAAVPATNTAFWINILKDSSLPNQPDPNAPNYNPVIARYAFWVEDECSKLDIGVSGNSLASGGFKRLEAVDHETLAANYPSLEEDEIGELSSAVNADIGALPLVSQSPVEPVDTTTNNQIVTERERVGAVPFDLGMINRWLNPGGGADVRDDIRFHASTFSLSNELSGMGRRRLNINAIVTEVDPTDANASRIIAADLDDLVFAMTGVHIFRDTLSLANDSDSGLLLDKDPEDGMLRNFGSRFYTNPADYPTNPANLKADHEKTYLVKLAANIRDYMDADRLPTFVNYQGNVVAGAPPPFAWTTGQEPVALGKESIPYLQKHAFYGRQLAFAILPDSSDPNVPKNRRRIRFLVDHYFNFYNPGNRDYLAPAGSTIRVYNRPIFSNGTAGPPVDLPDISLDISGITFPAGEAVVITTSKDSPAVDPPGLVVGSNIHRLAVQQTERVFNVIGNEDVTPSVGPVVYGTQMAGRNSATTDYRTEMIISTPDGVLDAHAFLAINADFSFTRDTETGNLTKWYFASSMRGNDNDAISRSGDVRSLSEPLQQQSGSNTAYGNDQARFFGDASTVMGNPANGYIQPANWPDYHVQLTNSVNTSYAVIADGKMKSIGELGHMYDPHRKDSPESQATISSARGGGRTLRIGQKDDIVNTSRFGGGSTSVESWFNAAWRLTDVFTADTSDDVLGPATERGKININGVLRDQGVAFRAALRAFEFLETPVGDPARSGQEFRDAEIDNLIAQIEDYLRTNGPMMERGELSQLDFFSGSGATNTAGTVPSATAYDRSREEIFRRTLDMITTRPASFTVYAVGQSVRQTLGGDLVVEGTSRKKLLFTLDPVIGTQVFDEVSGYELDKKSVMYE